MSTPYSLVPLQILFEQLAQKQQDLKQLLGSCGNALTGDFGMTTFVHHVRAGTEADSLPGTGTYWAIRVSGPMAQTYTYPPSNLINPSIG